MPDGPLEVDRSLLPELPGGWGYGQVGVPALEPLDADALRPAFEEQLKMKRLKKVKPGKFLRTLKPSGWRYSGELAGLPELSEELWEFVTGKRDDLSEDGQVGLLHYGHSWYAPPLEILRYHAARFGVMATFRAVCQFGRFHHDYKTFSLFERGDYEHSMHEAAGRLSQSLFELRHRIALFSTNEWSEAKHFADSRWDDIHPQLRPGVAFLLNDRALAARALETAPEVWYWNHHVNCAVAVAEPETSVGYAVRVPGNFLEFTPALLREHGRSALPLLSKLASGLKRQGDQMGDKAICRALAATPTVDTMSVALPFLRYKEHQGFIRSCFERWPDIGGEAVRRGLESKDAAERAAARVVAAVTDAKDALLPKGTSARDESLPSFLVEPPWKRKSAALKVKPRELELLPYADKLGIEPLGKPDHCWPNTKAKVIERLNDRSVWHTAVSGPALTLLTPEEFDKHAVPNASCISTSGLGHLVGKFGEERVIRLALAWSAGAAVAAFANADVARAAPIVAAAFALKTYREEARTWLSRFPEAAAVGLAPELFAKANKRKALATAAICELVELGHREVVLDVAKRYGNDVERAYEALTKLRRSDIVPPKIPKLDAYFNLTSLEPPRLRAGGAYLDEPALQHLCTMLAFSSYEDEYVGIEQVRDLCNAESLEAFAHSAFETWLAQGAAGKSVWAMLSLGWFGGDDAVRRLTPLIRKWPGEGGAKRAQIGLDVLAKIGTDAALSNVYSISQKLKYKSVQGRAEEVVQEIAESLELTTEELGDRVVPDFGLDDDGTTVIDYGPRRFKVRLDESLTPVLFGEDDKRLKTLPKPGKSDDEALAKEEKKRFSALKKDLRTVAKQQIQRLELAMCRQRSWSPETFQQYFLDHPLVNVLARRLIFRTGERSFAVDESRQPVDAEYEPVTLDGPVTIPHALHWSAEERARWGGYLADFELLQPFNQLSREVYRVDDYSVRDGKIVDFNIRMTAPKWVFGIEKHGWSRYEIIDGGGFYAHERTGPDGVVAVLSFDGAVAISYIEEKEPVSVTDLAFSQSGKKLAPKDVDPTFVSEVLRDIEALRP
ncbi:MAG: DUF4132 domain-containing protein [Myxococcota bacterium]